MLKISSVSLSLTQASPNISKAKSIIEKGHNMHVISCCRLFTKHCVSGFLEFLSSIIANG